MQSPNETMEETMLNKKIAFIGPGVMAEAVIAGLLRQKLAKPENIIASGPREERGTELHQKYKIQTTTDNAYAASHADVVVLSIKPQRLSEVMKGLKGVKNDALVISIIAGASMKKIGTGLKHKAVVRSMPNTPGQIGEGITVWTASKEPRSSRRSPATSWVRWARRCLSKTKATWIWQRLSPVLDPPTFSSSPRP
jgi:pyrroline-5-carboxylate reductase